MKPKSSSALYLLFAEGFCFLLIGAAVIACGFVLNYQSDFDYDIVDEQHDYTQYWVGFVVSQSVFYILYGTKPTANYIYSILMWPV
jgi:hypothetical protein